MKGKQMIWILLIVGGVVLCALLGIKGNCCCGNCSVPKPKPSEMAPSDLTCVVIDTRSQEEYAQGHLAGSPLMPYDQIGELIGKQVPEKSTPIRLYCHSGGRSEAARKTLVSMGYTDVKNLGGLKSAADTLKREIVK